MRVWGFRRIGGLATATKWHNSIAQGFFSQALALGWVPKKDSPSQDASFFRLRSLTELPTNERRKLRRTGCPRIRPRGVVEYCTEWV
jgi:hypothetical protein